MNTQAVEKSEKPMEFIPFGSEQKIKLTAAIVKNVCAVKTKGGRTCSDSDAVKFMMLCQGKGLNPFEGDAYLVGYDCKDGTAKFSQIVAHQSLLKRAEVHGEYKGMKSGIILQTEDGLVERESCFMLDDENVVGGWAVVSRNTKDPVVSKLSISQRKPEYPTPFWQGVKAAEQIQKCAEADALRQAFPSKIGGLFLREEMSFPVNVTVGPPDISTLKLIDVSTVENPPANGQESQGNQQESPSSSPPNNPPAQSARLELSQFCGSEGFTFDHFQRWALQSNLVSGADSIGSFDEVAEADAKRLLRSKAGLKKGLAEAKVSMENSPE